MTSGSGGAVARCASSDGPVQARQQQRPVPDEQVVRGLAGHRVEVGGRDLAGGHVEAHDRDGASRRPTRRVDSAKTTIPTQPASSHRIQVLPMSVPMPTV